MVRDFAPIILLLSCFLFWFSSDNEFLSLLQELDCEDHHLINEKEPLQKTSYSHQLNQQYFPTSSNISLEAISLNDPNRFRRLEGRRRRRIVNVKMLSELRIVKRDIRRRYIEMYNNVMNIHDHSLLSRFLSDLCTPTCSYIIRLPGTNLCAVKKGIKEIFLHAMESQLKIPDGVQCLTDGKIHVSLGKPGSRIISSISFRGTVLYKFRMKMEVDRSEQILSPNGLSSPGNSPSAEEKKEEYFADQNQFTVPPLDMFSLVPESKPTEVSTYGILTMILDDTNRIENFILQISDLHEFRNQ